MGRAVLALRDRNQAISYVNSEIKRELSNVFMAVPPTIQSFEHLKLVSGFPLPPSTSKQNPEVWIDK